MADGAAYARTDHATELISLGDAIARLEAGETEHILVDLGDGRTASVDGPCGPVGLLQRLNGHRILTALASGAAELPKPAGEPECQVLPGVKEILDVVHRKA